MAPVTIIHVAHDRCEACGRRHRSVLTLGRALRTQAWCCLLLSGAQNVRPQLDTAEAEQAGIRAAGTNFSLVGGDRLVSTSSIDIC
jgi:hypothetical protein